MLYVKKLGIKFNRVSYYFLERFYNFEMENELSVCTRKSDVSFLLYDLGPFFRLRNE